jgi:hypothetical protein
MQKRRFNQFYQKNKETPKTQKKYLKISVKVTRKRRKTYFILFRFLSHYDKEILDIIVQLCETKFFIEKILISACFFDRNQ